MNRRPHRGHDPHAADRSDWPTQTPPKCPACYAPVHGHTPPDKHKAISGMDDTHLFEGDRLCLDGGSTRTGIVAAAEIRQGRYRILKAGIAFENPASSDAE